MLYVRLAIKGKVGIPEKFKVGWYPHKISGSSHLKSSQSSMRWSIDWKDKQFNKNPGCKSLESDRWVEPGKSFKTLKTSLSEVHIVPQT